MDPIKQLRNELNQAVTLPLDKCTRFFKVGPGDYAAHDHFLGIRVPDLRKIAKKHAELTLSELQSIITSKYNEERMLALIILTERYKLSNDKTKQHIFQFYLKNISNINNWNLVDASAHLIVGAELLSNNDKSLLTTLAKSSDLWERRIAIVATWYFIRHQQFSWTLKLAKLLLKDTEDLIHKAVGWMLRELGKQDQSTLESFLTTHAAKMPRTMLRYAVERLPDVKRRYYLDMR